MKVNAAMHPDSEKSTISTPAELARHTSRFIDQFCRQSAFPSTVDIRVQQHLKPMQPDTSHTRPVRAILENQQLTVHYHEEYLMGISQLALQGWLDMELARCQLELEPVLYRVNFNKEIRPLLYISGSGVHLVRHMVVHLETSLKNLIAARLVIEMGHRVALLYSFFTESVLRLSTKKIISALFPMIGSGPSFYVKYTGHLRRWRC